MPKAGELIADKYELLEPLSGNVWKAVHKTLESPVVVKFVQQKSRDAVKRFIREAKAAAAVRHHNVVDIIDFGATEAGEPYMVLEHLTGETLEQRLARDPPMSGAEAIHIAALSLTGLAAVHEAGFIHRNLNPRNVFLVRDAEGSYPKILDFGVSKAVDTDSGQGLTLDGMVLGVPEYVAPEQVEGQRDIDERADVYSLGVILFEMLAGHRPFDPMDRQKVLVHKLAHDAPRLDTIRPELGGPLCDVVARALDKDRKKRFPDARSMRQALLDAEKAIDPAAIRAHAPPRGSLVPEKKRKEPAPAAAPAPAKKSGHVLRTIVLFVILAAASVYAIELWRPGTIVPAEPEPGAAGAITAPDAGVEAAADAAVETVTVTIRAVPDGSTISIDGAPIEVRRRGTDVLFDVPRRAGAFEIRVDAPGRVPFVARRWALRDVQVTARWD